ncbi:hypothetical protein [Micromonospora sp. CPCC 206061]|uniref:hypothetical protein n=1 Tax=Micromonospora sp. CPCC 206061 TaxID=3122410 RepID=UPI002FF28A2C
MTAPSLAAALTYACTDLDDFAAALADLAEAIERRDTGDTLTHLDRLAAADPDGADALADYLTFAGLFDPEEGGTCDDDTPERR